MNSQPIEKQIVSTGALLDIVGIFPTIQGEGPYTGHRATFIRLAGCNLQCPGCDTDYTSKRVLRTVGQIVEDVKDLYQPPNLIVITGGEPFRQNISPLVNTLINEGYHVQIETNGTLPPPAAMDPNVLVVVSPKTGKVNGETAERADAYKYVMHANSVDMDGLPIKALDHSVRNLVARPPRSRMIPVYIQPMDSKDSEQNDRNLRAVVHSCMTHGYILQLQIHKLIGVE